MTSSPDDRACRIPWTKSEIRAARQAPLKPVLERLGYTLLPAKNGNHVVKGVIPETTIKEHYWVQASTAVASPSTELVRLCSPQVKAGNAIDFLVKIRRLSFSEAMTQITNIQRERTGNN